MNSTETLADQINQIIDAFERGDTPTFHLDLLNDVPVQDSATVTALLRGLNSPAFRVVIQCAEALGSSSGREAERVAPALGQALTHPESMVRTAAAEALTAYGTAARDILPTVVQALQDEREAFAAKAELEALGSLAARPEDVLPVLLWLADPSAAQPADWVPDWLAKFEGWQAEQIVMGATGGLSRCRGVSVDVVLRRILPAIRQVFDQIYQTTISADFDRALNTLYERGEQFAEIVLTLLPENVLEGSRYESMAEALVPFVASEKFSKADLGALARCLMDERPPVRVRAASLITRHDGAATDCKDALLAALERWDDVETARAVVDALGQVEPDEAVAQALQRTRQTHGSDPLLAGLLRRTLPKFGVSQALPPEALDLSSSVAARFILPYHAELQQARLLHEALWFATHRQVQRTPEEEWLTDEDEFGLGRLCVPEPGLAHYPLPQKFPIRPSGARGDKRRLKFVGLDGDRLYFQLRSPLGTGAGRWEARHYLYRCNLDAIRSGAEQPWSLYRPAGHWQPLDAAHPLSEDLAASVTDEQELIAYLDEKGALVLVPEPSWHLDYVPTEESPEVQRARQAARKARERDTLGRPGAVEITELGLGHWHLKPAGPILRAGAADAGYHLYDVDRYVQAWLQETDAGYRAPGLVPSLALTVSVKGRRYLVLQVRPTGQATPTSSWECLLVLRLS